ncbi:MAG: sigma factor, partial [Acidobacteriota bacterium]
MSTAHTMPQLFRLLLHHVELTFRLIPRYPGHSADCMMIPGLILALELSGEHDEELARRLQRKEPQAMADLYDRFGRLAYSVVLSIVKDASLAEDLVQETFL